MTIVVQSEPEEEPVTVAEAKTHCRISTSVSDTEIAAMITAVRLVAEHQLRRYLITQTLDAFFDRFPSEIRLPPLQSVTSITYVDVSGDTQILAADQYLVDAKSQPARISPAYSVSWPSARLQNNAVTVRFVAGYGDADDVPQCIKHWILLRLAHYFDNRGAVIVGTSVSEMPPSYVDGLLDPERVMVWL